MVTAGLASRLYRGFSCVGVRRRVGRNERVIHDRATESTSFWTVEGRALVFSAREADADFWEVDFRPPGQKVGLLRSIVRMLFATCGVRACSSLRASGL